MLGSLPICPSPPIIWLDEAARDLAKARDEDLLGKDMLTTVLRPWSLGPKEDSRHDADRDGLCSDFRRTFPMRDRGFAIKSTDREKICCKTHTPLVF